MMLDWATVHGPRSTVWLQRQNPKARQIFNNL